MEWPTGREDFVVLTERAFRSWGDAIWVLGVSSPATGCLELCLGVGVGVEESECADKIGNRICKYPSMFGSSQAT